MKRRPLLCANWKMNVPPEGWNAKASPYLSAAGVDIVIFPTHLHIAKCMEAKFVIGAQCGRPEPMGAFTGDLSMQMLRHAGCTYVLCGHSERRQYHGETDEFIVEEIIAAIEVGLHPILCIGETKEEYDKGKAQEILKRQLSLAQNLKPLILAYEPIWAIGSGINALPRDAQNMHAYIRSCLPEESRTSTRIIYGGSVTECNAADFLSHPDIDGLLVGSVSLEPEKFRGIVEAAMGSSM